MDNIIIKTRDRRIIIIPEYQYNKLMDLTKKTLDQYPWSHIQAMIYGNKRIGKSIYIIKSMMEQYRIVYGYDIDTAFNEVMRYTFFTIRDFIDNMKKLFDNHNYIISCHIDDAACGFSSLTYFEEGGHKLIKNLKNSVNTIGNQVIGLYLSSPSMDGILSFLSTYESKVIKITSHKRQGHPWDRMAKIYTWRVLPSGTTRLKTGYDEDPYSCFLKKKYFDIYDAIRRTYTSDNLNKLDEAEKNFGRIEVSSSFAKRVLKVLEERLSTA